uniref:Uncharacterized protein n=1 Tax=Octopus bimaculoides TaxID=37653 RepID=A0A0L8GRF3_OCTBM
MLAWVGWCSQSWQVGELHHVPVWFGLVSMAGCPRFTVCVQGAFTCHWHRSLACDAGTSAFYMAPTQNFSKPILFTKGSSFNTSIDN